MSGVRLNNNSVFFFTGLVYDYMDLNNVFWCEDKGSIMVVNVEDGSNVNVTTTTSPSQIVIVPGRFVITVFVSRTTLILCTILATAISPLFRYIHNHSFVSLQIKTYFNLLNLTSQI